MAIKEKGSRSVKANFTIKENILKTFKSRVKELDISMSGAISILIRNFNDTGKLPSISIKKSRIGSNVMSKEEQAEIENDKELMESIRISEQEIREGKGKIVNV